MGAGRRAAAGAREEEGAGGVGRGVPPAKQLPRRPNKPTQTPTTQTNPQPRRRDHDDQAEPPADVARLKQHLKDAFSGFNAAVDRIRAAQSAWTVPDAALRAAVRRVIHADVVEPYQRFLRRCASERAS